MVGEIWCPTLGGTFTFIGLYGVLVFYYFIILLSYYFIILLFNYPIVLLSECVVQYFTFSYLAKENNNTPIIQ